MSISEKLKTIAENQQRVFNAGKAQGGGVTIEPDKIIERTARGNMVSLDDVSEIPHDVTIQLTTQAGAIANFSDVTIKKCGKNLFKNDTSLLKRFKCFTAANKEKECVGYAIEGLAAGIYSLSAIIKETTTTNDYIYSTINDKDGNFVSSKITNKSGTKNGNIIVSSASYAPMKYEINDGDVLYIYDASNVDANINTEKSKTLFNKVDFQLEVGVADTDFESYTEEILSGNANGLYTVKSECPYMNFIVDGDAVVNVTYNVSWGMEIENDRLWEKRKKSIGSSWSYAFAGKTWNDESLSSIPFDIRPSGSASAMFSNSSINNLKGTLEKAGVVLDLSGATNVNNMFQNSLATHLPKLDFSKCTASSTVFSYNTNLVYIEEFIPSPTATTTNMFQRCDNLEHCVFGGTISKSLNMADCSKLNAESIDSVFNNLGNANSGQTFVFPSTAQTTYNAVYGEGAFETKISARPSNWTIAY